MTMDDIATENGVSKRTLYEQFADKSQLLEACIFHMNTIDKEKIARIRSDSSNIIEFLLKAHFYQTEDNFDMYDHFASEVRKFYPDIYKKTIESFNIEQIDAISKVLLLGQRQGVFIQNIRIDIIAVSLNSVISTIKDMNNFTQYNFTRKELVTNMMLLCLRGMSTDLGKDTIEQFIKENNII